MSSLVRIPKDATHIMSLTFSDSKDASKIHEALDNKTYLVGPSDMPIRLQWTLLESDPTAILYVTTSRMASDFLLSDTTKILKRIGVQVNFLITQIIGHKTL